MQILLFEGVGWKTAAYMASQGGAQCPDELHRSDLLAMGAAAGTLLLIVICQVTVRAVLTSLRLPGYGNWEDPRYSFMCAPPLPWRACLDASFPQLCRLLLMRAWSASPRRRAVSPAPAHRRLGPGVLDCRIQSVAGTALAQRGKTHCRAQGRTPAHAACDCRCHVAAVSPPSACFLPFGSSSQRFQYCAYVWVTAAHSHAARPDALSLPKLASLLNLRASRPAHLACPRQTLSLISPGTDIYSGHAFTVPSRSCQSRPRPICRRTLAVNTSLAERRLACFPHSPWRDAVHILHATLCAARPRGVAPLRGAAALTLCACMHVHLYHSIALSVGTLTTPKHVCGGQ